jgi:hypothetical protein
MTLYLSVDNPAISLSKTSVSLTSQEWTEFTAEVNGSGDAKITLSADCRLYIDDMKVVDNTQTGIEDVEGEYLWQNNSAKEALYDLQGRRVYDLTGRGIYIKNGKKVVR